MKQEIFKRLGRRCLALLLALTLLAQAAPVMSLSAKAAEMNPPTTTGESVPTETLTGADVDYTGLNATIKEAKALNENEYTDGSWGNLYVAIMMAEMDINKPDVTQETIDNHVIAIRQAMKDLKKRIVVTELQAAIDEAKALNEKDYTSESWQAMQTALTAAEDEIIYQHSQEEVDAATAALRQAMKDLKKSGENKPTLPESGVMEVGTGDEMPDMIAADTTVILTADITLTKQIARIEGTLDGKGHTITVNGKPVAQEVTGTVQNLGVLSTAPITAAFGYPTSNGAITTNLNGGLIQTCYTTAEIKSFFDDMGGLAGVSVGGTVRNSYFAGKANGNGIGGILGASRDVNNMSTITDCYYAGVNKPVSMGNAYNDNDPSYGQKDLDFMKTATFAELLNTNLPDTGYHWESVGGSLPTLASGKPDGTPDANTENLNAAIKEAKALVETKYTPESWQAMQIALTAAQDVIRNAAAAQDQVDKAERDLRTAIAALKEKPIEIRTEAVALPAAGVIEITAQDQIKNMTAENTRGHFYRLANDIVIDNAYWYGISFAGVLDGNGHTITVANKNAIFEYLTADAVIQNVGFLGEVKGSGVDIGGVAVDSNGLIVNCWNRMIVSTEGNNSVRKDAAAFVAHLKKGGAIVNCYAAGRVNSKGNNGSGVPGAFAATSEKNTIVKNGMFLNTTAYHAVGNAAGQVENCTSQKRGGFYSQENLAALNANRGTYGKEWTIDNDGWFHLGAAGNFDPSVGAGMRFTFDPIYNRDPIDFSSGDGIELSMGDFLISADTEGEMPRILGTFSNPNFDGEIALVPEYTAVGQGSHGVMTYDDGGLVVSYPGDLTVHVMDKASWSGTGYDTELTSFTIVVTPITAEELRLIPHGKYVNAETNTVEGSGNVTTEAQIKVNGQWMKGNPTSFGFTIEGKVFGEGDGFRPTAPGKITIGCTGFGKSATLVMESTYVPVTLIRPYPYGVHWIHERDANSNKLGNFLDLNLADQAGRVYIEPENASYNGDGSWKMESSDPKIAEYIPDFLLAVLPYKAGKVTLTATSLDPNLKEPITGTSEIELKYTNPVTAVAVNLDELDETHYNAETGHMLLSGNEEILLPIHFTGTKKPEMHVDPNDGVEKEFSWHVSEPEMIWYQEGDGEVEIVINGNTGMWVKTPIENCVANDTFKITGVVNGTVTVTGVPADKTNKVDPITFTVEVTGVTDPEPYDIQGFISSALPSAINGVYSGINYKCSSDEWQVLSLLHAGEQLPQDKLDSYYRSVVETVATWKPGRKPTDYERVALALSAMGKDITNVGGVNIAERIYNHKYLGDGSNEVTFALLALDARNTEIPADARNTRQSMVDLLLSFQNPDGGFGLAPGSSSGADTTSMSLQALAPYQDQAKVAAAVESGLVYLKNEVHTKTGHFDEGTVEANAQTIIAMAVLGRDLLTEPGFSSARYNLMKAMEPYHVGGEGFKHTVIDPKINAMATAQALQALDAYNRFLNGKSGYWNFNDVSMPEINPDGHAVGPVIDAIHRLPDAVEVAERDRKNIEAARAAYDALTPEQQVLVDITRLTAAEEALANLNKPNPDKSAANVVVKLIENLPTEIKLQDQAAVEAARAAYDKLTAEQQKMVTNYAKLTAAEDALAKLEGGDPVPPAATNQVYFAVDRFVLGMGFITEPIIVEFTEGQTYADLIDKVLGNRASIRDNHNYLEMIRDANLGPDHVKIPAHVTAMSNNRCTTETVRTFYTDRGFEAWPNPGDLGEFSYSTQSGWYYHVNGEAPSMGIGENKVVPGAVVRVQYTVFGLGRDLGDAPVTNKDDLIRAMAIYNSASAEVQQNAEAVSAYKAAVAGCENMVTPAAEVKTLTQNLMKAMENAGQNVPDDAEAAKAVEDLIAALPATVTAAHADQIRAARNAYNALSAAQKDLVTNYGKLQKAEKALEDALTPEVAPGLEAALKNLQQNVTNPVVNTITGEWSVIAMARSGMLTQKAKANYLSNLNAVLTANNGVLSTRKYTEYSRVILALTAIGVDPTNVGGYNLVAALTEFDQVVKQGINGPIWALIALDSHDYLNPSDTRGLSTSLYAAKNIRDQYIDYILENELPGGGWSLTGMDEVDDITPMAIQALAPYYNRPGVKAAVDRAVARLEQVQESDGGFGAAGGSETISQVIMAFTALNSDLITSKQFVKNGSMIDALLTYQLADGAFFHVVSDRVADPMSTDQAALALQSYNRVRNGKTSIFDMSDIQLNSDSFDDQAKKDQEAARKVENLIQALPDSVTAKDKAAVEAARKAYNILTDAQKALVTNLDKLLKAEATLKKPGGGNGGGGIYIPGQNPGGQTVNNVVNAEVENNRVSKQQFADIQGKNKLLVIKGSLSNGKEYTLKLKGEDITNPEVMDMRIFLDSPYSKEMEKLAKDPLIFRFAEEGRFPGKTKVEMPVSLADGNYLLMQYDTEGMQLRKISKVSISDGMAQFLLEEGGSYLLSKQVSTKSLKEDATEPTEVTESTEATEMAEVTEETEPAIEPDQTEDGMGVGSVILIVIICLAAAVCVWVIYKKRK